MDNKTCQLDPISTNIIKQFIDELLPFVLKIINSCILEHSFPKHLKRALITPVIKFIYKDKDDYKNYHPFQSATCHFYQSH